MMVLNRVILIGRLATEPELRYTQTGVPVTTFRIAVQRPFTNQQGDRETDFFPIVTWRKLAEVCAHNLNKGRLVAVEGRLQTRSYQAQDGGTRWITEVVADNRTGSEARRPMPRWTRSEGRRTTYRSERLGRAQRVRL